MMWKEFILTWRSSSLLEQAYSQSYEMLGLSKEMVEQAIKKLHEHDNIDTLKALKKRDKEINVFQQEVRRKVVTHFSVGKEASNYVSGLVLLNMVVDTERIGDYAKNILDLAINHPHPLNSEEISEELHMIETEVLSRFIKTMEAIHTQDADEAQKLLSTYKEVISASSDRMVDNIIAGKETYGDAATTAAVALYARYLKRIGSHLKNITTTIVNPIDTIGYTR